MSLYSVEVIIIYHYLLLFLSILCLFSLFFLAEREQFGGVAIFHFIFHVFTSYFKHTHECFHLKIQMKQYPYFLSCCCVTLKYKLWIRKTQEWQDAGMDRHIVKTVLFICCKQTHVFLIKLTAFYYSLPSCCSLS